MVSDPAVKAAVGTVLRAVGVGDAAHMLSRPRFLLKYISRDELEVLTRGNGGVADFRDAVASYTELSPLYGFLRFRRRSVLVRYVPRETSRLIQGAML